MTNQTNIATKQQKFVIQIDSKTLNRVKPFDRQELVRAYLQMFSGFSWVNWTGSYSLGRAWQTALGQCGAFCDSKNTKNPAVKYLNAAYNGHKKYWSQIIMTHKNRENKINPQDEKIKQLREHGQRMIREAMDKINLILARYNEYTLEISRNATAEKPAPEQQMKQTPAPTPEQQTMQTPHTAQTAEIQPAQQQKPAIQILAQPNRVAMPMRAAQTAEIQPAQQQKPAVQTLAQPNRVTMPKQTNITHVAQPHKSVELQKEHQKTVTQQKKPYVAPTTTIKPAQTKKPYKRPTMSVRENQFAKPARQPTIESKAATFTVAELRIKRQINVFMFKNFNQRAA